MNVHDDDVLRSLLGEAKNTTGKKQLSFYLS